jgi:hypothetical protein
LTEAALLAPLFALLLLVFMAWARLCLLRLALIQLSRDSALLLARNDELWNASESEQLAAVRELAERQGALKPENLSLEFKTLSLPLLGSLFGLQGEGGHSFYDWIVGKFFGRRLVLRYQLRPQGLLGRIYPAGLKLEEDVAVLGDPWTLRGSDALVRLMR